MSASIVSLRMNTSTAMVDRMVNFFVEHEDLRTKSWFLSNSPGPLFMILVAYLYFCLSAGPRYMRDRKPYELKTTLLVYNALQVVFSWILLYEGYKGGWDGYYNFKCQPVSYTTDPRAMRMARAVWLYYIAKLTELLDTVFFVLRKKERQVSFLHLYHHTMMPICAFIGVKYFAGGHVTLLGFINSFIHIIMYTYYLLAALGPQVQKYLWWKKYLTIMQIIQFLIIFVHTGQLQFQPNCNISKFIAGLLTFNAALFTYMFSSFYVRNYMKNKFQRNTSDQAITTKTK
ncbi:elongation of very long chain fatty acids protein [Glossina fuscipes]|uniref:Elongation of very long chain fatty acids protein n=1 Tax=Glossina fuscipes TaxID=7396 RepID=A0A8U0WHP5_9MUSC|nr:elongation of very long chain fatty acids protein [Glossina fuscipes]KAI9584430.1 hypothetical protein GQX74_006325 [Glossina fuscipes]